MLHVVWCKETCSTESQARRIHSETARSYLLCRSSMVGEVQVGTASGQGEEDDGAQSSLSKKSFDQASVGMGPGEAPKVESRASQGFALGGRSDQCSSALPAPGKPISTWTAPGSPAPLVRWEGENRGLQMLRRRKGRLVGTRGRGRKYLMGTGTHEVSAFQRQRTEGEGKRNGTPLYAPTVTPCPLPAPPFLSSLQFYSPLASPCLSSLFSSPLPATHSTDFRRWMEFFVDVGTSTTRRKPERTNFGCR
eukprot:768103-Hanusia_phi.AAC.5